MNNIPNYQDHIQLSPHHVWTAHRVTGRCTCDNGFLAGQNAILENVLFPALAVNLVPKLGYC